MVARPGRGLLPPKSLSHRWPAALSFRCAECVRDLLLRHERSERCKERLPLQPWPRCPASSETSPCGRERERRSSLKTTFARRTELNAARRPSSPPLLRECRLVL